MNLKSFLPKGSYLAKKNMPQFEHCPKRKVGSNPNLNFSRHYLKNCTFLAKFLVGV